MVFGILLHSQELVHLHKLFQSMFIINSTSDIRVVDVESLSKYKYNSLTEGSSSY